MERRPTHVAYPAASKTVEVYLLMFVQNCDDGEFYQMLQG
jgi:hypothetical protein